MRIRIPTRLNQALDAVELGQWVSVAVMTVLSAAVLAVAVVMDQVQAGLGAVGIGALAFLGATSRARESRLREQIRQRDYDLAAKDAEIARLSAGDATAPTAQFLSIGESGELT